MPFSPTLPVNKEELIDKVVRLFGADDDNELRTVALTQLDEAVKEFNTYVFEFNLRTLNNITLVADQQDYIVDTAVYRESQAYLVDATSGNPLGPMFYIPSVQFDRAYTPHSALGGLDRGRPHSYTMRNLHEDGKVSVYPIPSDSTASAYTLTVEYYTRMPLISSLPSDESHLDVPQEVETALIYEAQKRMAIHVKGPADPDVGALDALANRALKRLIAIDRYHPDSNTRFKLSTNSRTAAHPARRNEAWIRVTNN